MQAAVAARLRILDIVLRLKQGNIILFCQHLSYLVNIVNERADNADPSDVVKQQERLNVKRKLPAIQLADNALRFFQTAFDVFDRISLVSGLEFVIQDLKLGLYFLDCAAVHHHKLSVLFRHLGKCFRTGEEIQVFEKYFFGCHK